MIIVLEKLNRKSLDGKLFPQCYDCIELSEQ